MVTARPKAGQKNVGLGLLLCGAYRWTDSLLVVWIGHGLLNAVMFLLLVSGYE